ncbi:MAG TPA: ATP-binding protein [Gammaproteobacteria bacterium]|nr:PAS domain-containing protein [Chromatiaceae bacterium]HOP15833.1 ATP-binding protein [Gammaproteobacteria bacterium]
MNEDKVLPVFRPVGRSQEVASDLAAEARASQDAAWIEVIRKMDETYADLVRYQVDLEEKNSSLEAAQQFIASVLASMTDVLIVCDAKGRIQQVNKAMEALAGESEATLKGRAFQTLLSSDCQPLAEQLVEKIRIGAVGDCEVTLCGRGEKMPLAMNCTCRYDARGRRVGMVLIGRPVGELRRAYEALHVAHSELQQAQRQLVNAEKMASLGRLVAGVAHELNNPISFVYGNVHALARYRERLARYLAAVDAADLPDDVRKLRDELHVPKILADIAPLLDGTLQGAERVRDLVQDLRRFSSGQSGERSRFDLVHVVATAVHWVTRGARQDLQIDVEAPPVLQIAGHPGQLQQVLMNLVQNAIDALRDVDRPRVEVRVDVADGMARVRVRDNGAGIAPDDLVRVFDPFFTTKPLGQGTGLGLSISYGIVTEHGGNLTAANHGQGGAVFTLSLPMEGAS